MAPSYMLVSGSENDFSEKSGCKTASHSQLALVRNLRLYLYMLLCLSFTLTLVVLALLLPRYVSPNSTNPDFSNYPSLALLPQLPEEIVVFREDARYATPSSPEADANWDHLLPPGRGYIYPPSPRPDSMPPGEPTPWGEIYSVALFHQLHCLGLLRSHWWMLLGAADQGAKGSGAELEALVKRLKAKHHINHCFDYLRQGIMCAGDLTLEWPREGEVPGVREVDGWGIEHQCRSWDSIMRFMEERHYNGSQRTDIA